MTITVDLENTGARPGWEVVQLYLGFPSESGEPPKQLKGFQKIQVSQRSSTCDPDPEADSVQPPSNQPSLSLTVDCMRPDPFRPAGLLLRSKP